MPFPYQSQKSSWKPTALVIDKDADTHRSIHVMLGKEYDVHHAYFPRLALSLLEKRSFNVVFTSTNMTGADDMLELQRTIESLSKDKGIPIISLADEPSASPGKSGSAHKAQEGERLLTALQTALADAAPAR